MTPEVKQTIANGVRNQLALENQEAQQNAPQQDVDPGSSGIARLLSDGDALKLRHGGSQAHCQSGLQGSLLLRRHEGHLQRRQGERRAIAFFPAAGVAAKRFIERTFAKAIDRSSASRQLVR
jgi:hypothetical protein